MFDRSIRLALVALLATAVARVAVADDVRVIITGWNEPTVRQFVRDAEAMRPLPFDGCALDVRAEGPLPNPFWSAFAARDWADVSFDGVRDALRSRRPTNAFASSYVVVKANPGNVDWLDDDGWDHVVDHWRTAAKLAKQAGVRGLLFDPEPYTKPFRQFHYPSQPDARNHPFTAYRDAARRRGRQVMEAIASEFPDVELVSYFLNSYLVQDHRYRGPSPVDRVDAEWCLASHTYGLLPAILDGWLDRLPATASIIDGCENGYWFKSRNEFFEHARDVRERGVRLVADENRETYRRQVKVGMPIYLDAIHPTLAGRYTLQPEVDDRLSLLRRNLAAAIDASDGFVWIYSEHGRWWPPPTDTALWHNKDVYPEWDTVLPGSLATIQDVRAATGSRSTPELARVRSLATTPRSVGPDLTPEWSTWTIDETGGNAEVTDGVATLTGVHDGAVLASIPVTAGNKFCVEAKVAQQGRGRSSLTIRFRDTSGSWLVDRTGETYAYPEDGPPSEFRRVTSMTTAPEGAAYLVATFGAAYQVDNADVITYRDASIRRVAGDN